MKAADLHCDTISVLRRKEQEKNPIWLEKNNLHIDLEKMVEGGYMLQNFAIFLDLKAVEDPYQECLDMIDLYYRELKKNKEKIAPAFCYQDIETNQKQGKISAVLTLEEGGMIKGDVENLKKVYQLGARMMTLTWNYPNDLAYPNVICEKGQEPDMYHPNTVNGLTGKGIEIVEAMEQLGIIVDVSHLSDAGFYDVLDCTKKPFVASHSNARAICKNIRNLTDDMIKKLSERGGIMGINYCPDFLADPKNGIHNEGSIEAIVMHIRHIMEIGGEEVIGLGSDFDGIGGHKELSNASYLPKLAEALKKEGMTEAQIDKIFYKNVLRVYKELL